MLTSGDRLGPYEIVASIGAGGMGEVYRARDTRLNRTVAIKILPPSLAADPASTARFKREAEAVAALHHPNICVLHDIGRERLRARARRRRGARRSRAAERERAGMGPRER